MARKAATRSFSSTSEPSALSSAGDTVLQYGQTSAFFDGVHTAWAPQAGQMNFWMAVVSDMPGMMRLGACQASIRDAFPALHRKHLRKLSIIALAFAPAIRRK